MGKGAMNRALCKTRVARLPNRICPVEFKRRAVYLSVWWLTALCAIFLIWQVKTILLLIFAGCISALVFATFVSALQRLTRLRRSLAFLLAVLLFGSSVILIICWIGPGVVQQLNELRSDIPVALRRIVSSIQERQWGRWFVAQWADPDQLSRAVSFVLSRLGGAVAATVSLLAGSLVVFLLTIHLSAEPDFYRRGLQRLVPASRRSVFNPCLDGAIAGLRSWILSKLISMTAIGLFVSLGLWILQVPLAGILGGAAALLTFIPNLGPMLSVLPAALLAFAISPAKGLLTLALFALAHFLEGNLVTPLAERAIVKLPPALTLSMQLVLGTLTGPLGIALAAPLTAAMLGTVRVLLPPVGTSVPNPRDVQTFRSVKKREPEMQAKDAGQDD